MCYNNYIIEREMKYRLKDCTKPSDFKLLIVRLGEPYLVVEGMPDFEHFRGFFGCLMSFDGLDEISDHVVYGIDPVQALSMAIDFDGFIRSQTDKYDFFWGSGDEYFDHYEQ